MLHYLTRTWQVESLKELISACPGVVPVADGQGKTAVEVALQLDQIDAAKLQWQKLALFTTPVSASLMMQELQLMSKAHPYLVRPFLLDVEPVLVQTLATFRTELA